MRRSCRSSVLLVLVASMGVTMPGCGSDDREANGRGPAEVHSKIYGLSHASIQAMVARVLENLAGDDVADLAEGEVLELFDRARQFGKELEGLRVAVCRNGLVLAVPHLPWEPGSNVCSWRRNGKGEEMGLFSQSGSEVPVTLRPDSAGGLIVTDLRVDLHRLAEEYTLVPQ